MTYLCSVALDHQSLNLNLDRSNLRGQVARLVRRDAACDHGTGHTAGASEGGLARDVDVGDVLVFSCMHPNKIMLARLARKQEFSPQIVHGKFLIGLTQQWQVQQNSKRLRIGCQDDNLGRSAVEGLRGCIRRKELAYDTLHPLISDCLVSKRTYLR